MVKETKDWIKKNGKALGIGIASGVVIGISGVLIATEFLTYDGGGYAVFDDLYIYDTEVAERVKKNLNPFERLNVYRVATEALWQFAEMSP